MAAQVVSIGFMLSAAGSINPKAANRSTIPSSLTCIAGSCPIHGIIADILGIGINFITVPDSKNKANNI